MRAGCSDNLTRNGLDVRRSSLNCGLRFGPYLFLVSCILYLLGCGNAQQSNPEPDDAFFSARSAIPPFHFTDQHGQPFTRDSVKGRVYVADFIFTRCQTICPKMTDALAQVQAQLKAYQDFRIVSHTLDPNNDSVEVLKRYADEHGAITGKWFFVTGEHADIYGLSQDAYKSAAQDLYGIADSIKHSSRLILVNRDGVIVDYFDSENPEEVQQLITEAKGLLKQ